MHNITIAGLGHVGLATAVCMAELGHRVTGYDIDAEKCALLARGEIPFSEPGMADALTQQLESGRLRFTDDSAEAMRTSDYVFICVGTPAGEEGEADLRQVASAVSTLGQAAQRDFTLVVKSTVPPGAAYDEIARLAQTGLAPGVRVNVVVNPEFLREGTALFDSFYPERIVIGCDGSDGGTRAAQAVGELYSAIHCPTLYVEVSTALMIKYASNAFLATKISFVNELATIAARVGGDIRAIAEGMGLDGRIGADFLEAGIGYGGACFSKDVQALTRLAARLDAPAPLLRAVTEVNASQRQAVVRVLHETLGPLQGKRICLLGLSFKAGTDDIRDAPSLDIIAALRDGGASVRTYDPLVTTAIERVLPSGPHVQHCRDAYHAAEGSDAVVIATNWPEFRQLDWKRIASRMSKGLVVDGRNLLEAEAMRLLGIQYRPVTG